LKKITVFAASILFTAALAQAVTITPGTPENGNSASSTGPAPLFGTRFTFDSLTPNSTFSASTYAAQGVTISSPDGLVVSPYSTQSGPNELFDNSSDGSANIKIVLTKGTNEIGIGIADSDGVPVTIEALSSTGAVLGTLSSTMPNNTVNPFNGYFVASDGGNYDIYGLAILQASGNAASFSGLAIDDLQVNPTPEPATLAMFGVGAVLLGAFRVRARSRA